MQFEVSTQWAKDQTKTLNSVGADPMGMIAPVYDHIVAASKAGR